VSPRANKILLRHHVEHSTIAPACAALAQEQLSTYDARDGYSTAVSVQSRASPCMACAPQSPLTRPTTNKLMDVALFMHSVGTRANSVKYSHQAMCNPKISSLLKALRTGFLKGCPNLSEELVTKYLNPSPATAKGHMRQMKKGIRSMKKRQ